MSTLDLGYDLSEHDPMVAQYNSEDILLESLPSTSHAIKRYTFEEHAAITFDFFKKLRETNKFNDVSLESKGRIVITANRLILSTYSGVLEAALLEYQKSTQVAVNLNPTLLSINAEDVVEIVDYMYSGECTVSKNLRRAAEMFECTHLLARIAGVEDGTVIHDDAHALNFQRKLESYRINGLFLDCSIAIQNKESLKCHRLVLCAHSQNLKEPLINSGKTSQLSLDLDHKHSDLMKASGVDTRSILEFAYCGSLKGNKKRYLMLRAVAHDLGVTKLVELLNYELTTMAEAENDIGERFNPFEMPIISREFHFPNHRRRDSINDEDDAEYENAEDAHRSLVEVNAQDTEDYVSIYEEYVLGPSTGKPGGTYGTNRPNLIRRDAFIQFEMSEESPELPLNEEEDCSTMAASYTFNATKKKKNVDSYGYGLPEYQNFATLKIPLAFGNQKEMMERPFKCNYCDYRAKEKAGIEKHVRSVHTGETPYKCNYCRMAFKVQSNLVRHIRTHTGEKPYVCKKCGIAYADKKNMDAHVFREHLKTQMIVCSSPNCGKKFWRHDRFSLHCLKVHGSLPAGLASLSTDHV